jgi:hypothetical protein
MFTFFFNTIAEIVRHRLRRQYSSLWKILSIDYRQLSIQYRLISTQYYSLSIDYSRLGIQYHLPII